MNSISSKNIKYLEVCKLASTNDRVFDTFKQNPHYTSILEHTSYEAGLLCYEYIQNIFPEYIKYIELFKQNDTLGSATTHSYALPIGNISPSTLRYIKVLSEIKFLFPENFNDKTIVEIGCGYGGQCFIFSQIFPNCKYYIVDLPETQELIKKYLNRLNLKNYEIISPNDLANNVQYDLVISNYAYSELDLDLQNYYYDTIIRNSKHGYFTLNFISNLFDVHSYSKDELISKFQKDKNISIIPEQPLTFKDNIILYF